MRCSGKIGLLCLTSSDNAIAQSFRDIVCRGKDEEKLCFIGTRFTIPEALKYQSHKVLHLKYEKNLWIFFSLLSILWKIRLFVKQRNISRLFIYSPLPINGLLIQLLPMHVEVALWVHDPTVHSGERLRTRLGKFVDDRLVLSSRKMKSIAVASDFLNSMLKKTPFVAIRNTKVIPFPYISELVSYNPKPIKKKQVIFFGRVEKYKGVDWACESLLAHSDIFGEKPSLLIAGKGDSGVSTAELEKVGYTVEIYNRFVDSDELTRLIDESAVAIFPYRDATSTLAVQTAGAMGCWIVASDVGGLPELVEPGCGSAFNSMDRLGFCNAINQGLTEAVNHPLISEIYRNKYSPQRYFDELIEYLDLKNDL